MHGVSIAKRCKPSGTNQRDPELSPPSETDAFFERLIRDMRKKEAQEAEKEGRGKQSREQDQPRH